MNHCPSGTEAEDDNGDEARGRAGLLFVDAPTNVTHIHET
jgi:hypothetical protein